MDHQATNYKFHRVRHYKGMGKKKNKAACDDPQPHEAVDNSRWHNSAIPQGFHMVVSENQRPDILL